MGKHIQQLGIFKWLGVARRDKAKTAGWRNVTVRITLRQLIAQRREYSGSEIQLPKLNLIWLRETRFVGDASCATFE